MKTSEYRKKYIVPEIADDINALCDKIDKLESIIRHELMVKYSETQARNLAEELERILS